jgi:hypothetical protein
MSEHLEIRRLIADQATSEQERQELLQVARALEVTLAREAIPRPGFQADLRRRLLVEAARIAADPRTDRRAATASPPTGWRRYHRPLLGAGAVAAAALVAVLSYGAGRLDPLPPSTGVPTEPGPVGFVDSTGGNINTSYQVPPVAQPGGPTEGVTQNPGGTTGTSSGGKPNTPNANQVTGPLTIWNMPDELGAPPAYFAGLAPSDRVARVDYQVSANLPTVPAGAQLLYYRLEGVPLPGGRLVELAQRAGFDTPPSSDIQSLLTCQATRRDQTCVPTDTAAYAARRGRWLKVDTSGLLSYSDDRGQAQAAGSRQVATAQQAVSAARAFLGQLQVIAPDGTPRVTEGAWQTLSHAWHVEWTPRMPAPAISGEPLPLLGQTVLVVVADNGIISYASLDLGRLEAQAMLPLKPPEEALAELQSRPSGVLGKAAQMTITVEQVDLVYGRPPAGEVATVYALPYYRFQGVTDQGWPITQYVPAVLAGERTAR